MPQELEAYTVYQRAYKLTLFPSILKPHNALHVGFGTTLWYVLMEDHTFTWKG